ncbi:MAG: hypothetical protein QXG00_05840 [Candidatus Woesearchaeota archaeon]
MFRLSLIITFLLIKCIIAQSSPHGENLKLECESCHNETSWNVLAKPLKFNHDETNFRLVGQHNLVNCKSCHNSLKFEEANSDCKSCHRDVHQNTAGIDCQRCHTPESWLVKNIKELHSLSRFPLVGVHENLNCQSCHSSINNLKFEVLNIDCYSCHKTEYETAKNPDHLAANFSTNCFECHNFETKSWSGKNFSHAFFPLTGGHEIRECYSCHQRNTFSGLSAKCLTCHYSDYEQTSNPNHRLLEFSTDCENCHETTNWKSATFEHDNSFFPIYTGEHRNEWDNCGICHTDPNNYQVFSCINCHEHRKSKMDQEHQGVAGYVYNSQACYNCHPNGNVIGSFNHNQTGFSLTGVHSNLLCTSCHQNGFSNTPNQCYECHLDDYEQTNNPNHQALNIPINCEECHNTNTGWSPALFPIHNNYYALSGSHINVSCNSCHQSGYNNTPTECEGCHMEDYNQTQNPNHQQIGMNNQCNNCHTTQSWVPSTFNHTNTSFPLSGSHLGTSCSGCHQGQTTGTPTICFSCHQTDYNQATNPNHTALSLPTDCSQCHTTNPQWQPALFPIHNNYYPLTGQHYVIRDNCISCHNGNYNNTPNQCQGCHMSDYNTVTNPNHVSLQFPQQCDMCHTTNTWSPSTFNHDQQYFPIYTGEHRNEWDNCGICHTDPNNYQVFSCINCHEHRKSKMDQEHQGVAGYVYNSQACYNCHPNGNAYRTKNKYYQY